MVELNCDYVKVRDKGRMVICLRIPKAYEQDVLFLTQHKRVEKTSQLHVRIAIPRKPRSTGPFSQSHHFNGHIQQICIHTGDSFDDCKMHVKREAVGMGYPMHTDSFGNMVPNSESEASTDECAILIEAAHMVASDLGVILREE